MPERINVQPDLDTNRSTADSAVSGQNVGLLGIAMLQRQFMTVSLMICFIQKTTEATKVDDSTRHYVMD